MDRRGTDEDDDAREFDVNEAEGPLRAATRAIDALWRRWRTMPHAPGKRRRGERRRYWWADRLQPLGRDGLVELRRFLQRRHVARFDRDRLPRLVGADDRILWVSGVGISAAARLRLDTRRCIEVRAGCW